MENNEKNNFRIIFSFLFENFNEGNGKYIPLFESLSEGNEMGYG